MIKVNLFCNVMVTSNVTEFAAGNNFLGCSEIFQLSNKVNCNIIFISWNDSNFKQYTYKV